MVACFELGMNEVLREIEPGVLSVAALAALLHDRPSRSRPIGPSVDDDDDEEPLEEPSASDKARMDGIKGQHAHFGPVHVPLYHVGAARPTAPEVTVETSPAHHSPVPSASTRAPAPALHTARSAISSSSSSMSRHVECPTRRASWAAKPPSSWRTGDTPTQPRSTVTPRQGPAGGGGRSPSFWDDSGRVADIMTRPAEGDPTSRHQRPSTASSAVSSVTTPAWWFNSTEPTAETQPSRPQSAKSRKKVVVNENSLAAGKATVRREPFQIGQAQPQQSFQATDHYDQHRQGKRTVHIDSVPKGPKNPFVKQLLG